MDRDPTDRHKRLYCGGAERSAACTELLAGLCPISALHVTAYSLPKQLAEGIYIYLCPDTYEEHYLKRAQHDNFTYQSSSTFSGSGPHARSTPRPAADECRRLCVQFISLHLHSTLFPGTRPITNSIFNSQSRTQPGLSSTAMARNRYLTSPGRRCGPRALSKLAHVS